MRVQPAYGSAERTAMKQRRKDASEQQEDRYADNPEFRKCDGPNQHPANHNYRGDERSFSTYLASDGRERCLGTAV